MWCRSSRRKSIYYRIYFDSIVPSSFLIIHLSYHLFYHFSLQSQFNIIHINVPFLWPIPRPPLERYVLCPDGVRQAQMEQSRQIFWRCSKPWSPRRNVSRDIVVCLWIPATCVPSTVKELVLARWVFGTHHWMGIMFYNLMND